VDREILQLKEEAAAGNELHGRVMRNGTLSLQKMYLETASTMAKAARSAVVLGGRKEGEIYKEIAYAYGRNLGNQRVVCWRKYRRATTPTSSLSFGNSLVEQDQVNLSVLHPSL